MPRRLRRQSICGPEARRNDCTTLSSWQTATARPTIPSLSCSNMGITCCSLITLEVQLLTLPQAAWSSSRGSTSGRCCSLIVLLQSDHTAAVWLHCCSLITLQIPLLTLPQAAPSSSRGSTSGQCCCAIMSTTTSPDSVTGSRQLPWSVGAQLLVVVQQGDWPQAGGKMHLMLRQQGWANQHLHHHNSTLACRETYVWYSHD